MCGILGAVNIPFEDSTLDIIRRRGPDDCGIERFSINGNSVVFGHRRLSIVDPGPAGHQPMMTADKRRIIIFNGEIYNHLDLRRKLSDVCFRGHSDTETILYYLDRYGIEGISHFNGIFSFAFLDIEKAKLVICRDYFGVKPLYYAYISGKFLFSSELKPIQSLIQDSVEVSNIATLLRLRYSPSPYTLFRHIHKVRPGHIVTVDLNTGYPVVATESYSYKMSIQVDTPATFSDAVDEYGDLLEQAVCRQLMSDVEVGILLSGGIDSALIAQIAQNNLSYRMKAFTVGYHDDDDSDETADAQDTAGRYGLRSLVTKIGIDDFLDIIKSCVAIVEEPLATTSIIPMYYLARHAAKNVKVVLSGQGADELLGGYGRYQGELYRKYVPPLLASVGKKVVDFTRCGSEQIIRGLNAFRFEDDIDHFLSVYSVFQDKQIEMMLGVKETKSKDILRYYYNLLSCAEISSSVSRMMALDMNMNLADDLLLYTDKVTMHFSLECRVPMLDLDLVKFVQSLPYQFRLKIGRTKIIHRAWARTVLPAYIIDRKKKGFQSPTKKWFNEEGVVWEMLLAKGTRFSTYIDQTEVEKVLLSHKRGVNHERHIFLLLGLCCWLELYG